MNERNFVDSSSEEYFPKSARDKANETLDTIMYRFESAIPLSSSEYSSVLAGVEIANDLFTEADLIGEYAEVATHADHIFLPNLMHSGTIWPENSVQIPFSHATSEPFGVAKGYFRGVSFALSHDDTPVLYYHIATDGHSVEGYEYRILADVRHSMLTFESDWPRQSIFTDTEYDNAETAPHLTTIAQLGDALRDDGEFDYEQAVKSIDFLLNKSSFGKSAEFRQQLAQFLQESLPQETYKWNLRASRAVERHEASDQAESYTSIDEPVSVSPSSLELQCLPRMRTRISKNKGRRRLTINNQRYDLYFVAPNPSGEHTLLIPFDAIDDIFTDDEDSGEEW